jgi:hypothetical protein
MSRKRGARLSFYALVYLCLGLFTVFCVFP